MLLKKELAKPAYRCAAMSLGTNTDPYQPLEREHRITRQILEVPAVHRLGNLPLDDLVKDVHVIGSRC